MTPPQETPCRIPCRPSGGPLCAYCGHEEGAPHEGSARLVGYIDGGLGRVGLDPLDRCYRDRSCALLADHGGACDPRSEPERWHALTRALTRGLDGEAPTAKAMGSRR